MVLVKRMEMIAQLFLVAPLVNSAVQMEHAKIRVTPLKILALRIVFQLVLKVMIVAKMALAEVQGSVIRTEKIVFQHVFNMMDVV